MTDREAAAGLVERLERRISSFEITANGHSIDAELHRRSQAEIRSLLAQIEELRRERDTCFQSADDNARAVNVAEARATKAEAGIAEAVSTMTRLCTAAGMLQQNAEGCAINHYGHDFETHGLPGWLTDTRADIDAARAFIDRAKESRS